MFYPPGAHSLDIQVPGRPRSLLFTPCRYHYASLNTADFVNQRKAVLCMVTQAPGRLQNSGEVDVRWRCESICAFGAVRFQKLQGYEYSGACCQERCCHAGRRSGDIDLLCVDNMGNPVVLTLKDVLCIPHMIPEANKSLISVSMLAK